MAPGTLKQRRNCGATEVGSPGEQLVFNGMLIYCLLFSFVFHRPFVRTQSCIRCSISYNREGCIENYKRVRLYAVIMGWLQAANGTDLLKGRKHSSHSGKENGNTASLCETLFLDNLEDLFFCVCLLFCCCLFVKPESSFLKAKDIFP